MCLLWTETETQSRRSRRGRRNTMQAAHLQVVQINRAWSRLFSCVPLDGNVKSAVNRYVLAGNIRSGVREQKANRLDRLFRLRPTAHRDFRQNAIAKFVAPYRFRHWGFDHPETNRIRADAELRPFFCGGHCHPQKTTLRRGVVDLSNGPGSSRIRRYID